MVLKDMVVLIQYGNHLVIFYHNVPFFAAIFTFWERKDAQKSLPARLLVLIFYLF
jgi:hypothetical protein